METLACDVEAVRLSAVSRARDEETKEKKMEKMEYRSDPH